MDKVLTLESPSLGSIPLAATSPGGKITHEYVQHSIYFIYSYYLHDVKFNSEEPSGSTIKSKFNSDRLAQVVSGPVQPYSAESWPKTPIISIGQRSGCCFT